MSTKAWAPQVDRLVDIRRQHEDWLRQGYDGHNRKSGRKDAGDLRKRSRRRRKQRQLAALANDWQNIARTQRTGRN